MGGAKPTMDGLGGYCKGEHQGHQLKQARMARRGVGVMLFAIRNQLTIFVVMAVFSTGLTLGLSCVYIYIYIYLYTYTQKCTYTHEGESDSKSDVIIYCREKGVPHTICWGKKPMLVSSLKI